jgi:hypothetical protein
MSAEMAQTKTTYSGYWKHESACNLFETGHEVREDFVDVLKKVAGMLDHDVEYAAAGCSGCAYSTAPSSLFWTAQGDATDTMFVKYDSDVVERKELAESILEAAEDLGVPADWDGDEMSCVCLGDAEFYED